MGIVDFTVSFIHDGMLYSFDAANINRNLTDGGNNPIFSVRVCCENGRMGVCNLTPDWRIISLYMD